MPAIEQAVADHRGGHDLLDRPPEKSPVPQLATSQLDTGGNTLGAPLKGRSGTALQAHGLCQDSARILHCVRTVAILVRTR